LKLKTYNGSIIKPAEEIIVKVKFEKTRKVVKFLLFKMVAELYLVEI